MIYFLQIPTFNQNFDCISKISYKRLVACESKSQSNEEYVREVDSGILCDVALKGCLPPFLTPWWEVLRFFPEIEQHYQHYQYGYTWSDYVEYFGSLDKDIFHFLSVWL